MEIAEILSEPTSSWTACAVSLRHQKLLFLRFHFWSHVGVLSRYQQKRLNNRENPPTTKLLFQLKVIMHLQLCFCSDNLFCRSAEEIRIISLMVLQQSAGIRWLEHPECPRYCYNLNSQTVTVDICTDCCLSRAQVHLLTCPLMGVCTCKHCGLRARDRINAEPKGTQLDSCQRS